MRYDLLARAGVSGNHDAFPRRIEAVAEGFRPLPVGHAKGCHGHALVLVDQARLHVVRPHHQSVPLLQPLIIVRISMSSCQASSTCLVISSKPSGPYTSNSVRPITHGVRIKSG